MLKKSQPYSLGTFFTYFSHLSLTNFITTQKFITFFLWLDLDMLYLHYSGSKQRHTFNRNKTKM